MSFTTGEVSTGQVHQIISPKRHVSKVNNGSIYSDRRSGGITFIYSLEIFNGFKFLHSMVCPYVCHFKLVPEF